MGVIESLAGRRILFGVTGSIAAYKACGIVSALIQRGADVSVVMTTAATRFVAPLTFAALTGRSVLTELWEAPETIPHIRLIRDAELLIIAPATAQTLAKIALGFADDLLTNAALAARVPIILAPAMNSAMYEHSATQAHLATLRARGVIIIEPGSGFLAEREQGVGRLADDEKILGAIDALLLQSKSLSGMHVLITAGPTREALDPVRFLSNAATGATGLALAVAAHGRGAQVRIVLGPTALSAPIGIEVLRVTTAAEMHAAVMRDDFTPDIIIATAAVADERPRVVSAEKLSKRDGALQTIACEPTVDIAAALRARFSAAYLVGFAAETRNHEQHARAKLREKQLDAIIANDVRDGRGFGAIENTWMLLTDVARYDIAEAPKALLAHALLDHLSTLYAAKRTEGR